MALRTLASTVALLALTACGNLQSIHHTFKPSKGESISIDAKQRAIFTIDRAPPGADPWTVVCAEPSPDALSALSASAALDAAGATRALGLALGVQEGATSIGLRTQTITILRDAMYRLCEGYASGALDDIAFARLQRRYQNIMLGLLAIEQITGAAIANQGSIGGTASAKLGQSLAQMTVLIQATRERAVIAGTTLKVAKTTLDGANKELKDAQDAFTKATGTNADVTVDPAKSAKATVDAKTKAAAAAKDAHDKAVIADAVETAELNDLQAVRKELDRAAVFTSTTANFSTPTKQGQTLDATGVDKVATAVTTIVTKLVDRDYTRETCMDTLMSRAARTLSKDGNTDALELAVRYCAYALEADSIALTGAGAATQQKSLADSRQSFVTAINEVFSPARREQREKELAAKKAPEKK